MIVNLFKTISRFKINIFTASNIKDDDIRRKAFVLNTILKCFLALSFIGLIHGIYGQIMDGSVKEDNNYNLVLVFIIVFSILGWISSKGFPAISASIIVGLLLLACLQVIMKWGTRSYMAIAIYPMIIVMSGILVKSAAAIFVTVLIALSLIVVFLLQQNGILVADYSWIKEPQKFVDIIVLISSYFVIAVISWLSGKEIIKNFKLSKISEKKALRLAKNLKRQKESLEILVKKRTKELREHQLQQLMKINNLAAYGRVSAGLLHDIKNPLTVISLNLDSLKDVNKGSLESKKKLFSELIEKSLMASKTVEDLIKCSNKQLLYEGDEEVFDLNKEIKNTLLILKHRALRYKIELKMTSQENMTIKGYPSKLSRVLVNLVMNSIDSFKLIKRKNSEIEVVLRKEKKLVIIEVIDNGCGIKDEHKNKIFEPLFSTKKCFENSGLGLYSSHKIIQDYFKGDIKFESWWKKGSKFRIEIPINKND